MGYSVKFTVYGIVYSIVYLEPDGLAAIGDVKVDGWGRVLGYNDR